jgi:hypothetical protein
MRRYPRARRPCCRRARGRSLEPDPPVDAHTRGHRVTPDGLHAGDDVAKTSKPVLQAGVSLANHDGVEPDACHDAESLTVDDAEVERPLATGQAHVHRFLKVSRDAKVARKQIRGACRQDCERDRRRAEGIQGASHGTVTAPHEQEVNAGRDQLRHG